jgi:cyclase
MDADGTKAGFDNDLNRRINEVVNIPIIASGGAGTMKHIKEAFTLGHADAALAASIFHFKEIDIMDLKHYLHDHNIPVRR